MEAGVERLLVVLLVVDSGIWKNAEGGRDVVEVASCCWMLAFAG